MAYSERGYPRLAVLMGKAKSIAIFRRFDKLSMLCLLSQTEIVQLEKEYEIECYVDDTGEAPESQAVNYTGNFRLARDSNSEQYVKLVALRGLLKEYIFSLNQIDKPLPTQLTALQSWLNQTPFLTDYETATYDSSNPHTYLCLDSPLSTSTLSADRFTRWLLNTVTPTYDRLLGRFIGSGEVIDPQTGDKSYSSEAVNRTGNIVTAVMASAVPVLAIWVLNRIGATEVRIGVTAGFTVAFAVLMGVFSSAGRAEMIAATATFAAIEVVFIGSAIGGGGQSDQCQCVNTTVAG